MLAAAAAEWPGRTALVDDRIRLSWSDWLDASCCIAEALAGVGMKPGDTLAYIGEKSAALPCFFMASIFAGGRFLSASPLWPEQSARRIAAAAGRSFVACSGQIPPAWRDCPTIPATLPPAPPPADLSRFPDCGLSAEVYLNVTSASTGVPRVVATTAEQLVRNTLGVSRALGLSQTDVHMSLFSSYGHPHELFVRGLVLGGTSVLTASKYPREAIALIAKHDVTALMGLPPQLEGLARVSGRGDADLRSLRVVEAGGMHVSAEFAALFESLCSRRVISVWGSTETSGVAMVGDPGSEGFNHFVEDYSVELRDPGGSPLHGDCEGELWIAGPAVAGRYVGDRASSSESFVEGWFRTGDVFRRSGEKLHFVGRRGGLVKSAGLKVYPLEVELALLRHSDVAEAAVAGESHPSRGETVTAWIVAKPGRDVTPAGLRHFLRGILDEYKIPRNFNMVPDLPRTPGGKIDRTALGRPPAAPEWRGELLRTDLELVRLLNHRASILSEASGAFDPNWLEEQLENASGHNPGPLSDDSVREIVSFIQKVLSRR
jgi:acyl-CoA synthetase (AMP-forming)/AMP-acid ligase II